MKHSVLIFLLISISYSAMLKSASFSSEQVLVDVNSQCEFELFKQAMTVAEQQGLPCQSNWAEFTHLESGEQILLDMKLWWHDCEKEQKCTLQGFQSKNKRFTYFLSLNGQLEIYYGQTLLLKSKNGSWKNN